MADATFSDVVKTQQETNEILRQQAIADGKPDPKKFIKEEFIAIAAQRGYAKKDRELQTKTAKTVSSSEKKDQEYYKKQLEEQTDTTGEQKVTSSHLSNLVSNLKDLPAYIGSLVKGTKVSGAEKKEEENKKKFRETRTAKILTAIPKTLGKVASSLGGFLKNQVKGGAKGIFGILKKLGLGALAIMALNFLNNPEFGKTMKFIRDDVIPVVGKFLENVIKPLWKNIKIAFFDVLESLGKFFDDPGLKETMDLLRKGDLFGAFMKFAGTIFKPNGLIDNLATNLTNLFLRIFGLKPIDGKETVMGLIGKQFTKFYAQFQNTFRQLINDTFEFLGMEKRLDLIDENTGKNIESDYNKKIRIRKEGADYIEERESAKTAQVAAATGLDLELKKAKEKSVKVAADSTASDRDKIFAKTQVFALEKKIKEAVIQSEKIKTKSGIAGRGALSRSSETRIEKLQDNLNRARILESEKEGEQFAKKIKLLENEIARIKSEKSKQASLKDIYNQTQVNQMTDESTRVNIAATPLSPANESVKAIQAAINS